MTEEMKMLTSIDAQILLRRFCFLGVFDCVHLYQDSKAALNVKRYYVQVKELCKDLDSVFAERLLNEALLQSQLLRADETLFFYACYLESANTPQRKLTLRKVFPALILSDTHMFLFCKYATLIRREQNLKGLSNGVRKALISWYKCKTLVEIRKFLLLKRSAYGFTHKHILHMCHINDATLGAKDIYKQLVQKSNEVDIEQKSIVPNGKDAKQIDNKNILWQAVCCLRVVKYKDEALSIIKKHQLKSEHVPNDWQNNNEVLSLLIGSMKFWELMQHWRRLVKQKHKENDSTTILLLLIQKQLLQRNVIRAANIHPLALLMEFQRLGVRSDYKMLRHNDKIRVPFLQDLYSKCFGKNHNMGVRMCFVLNLQESYKNKSLKHCPKVTYYHAAIGLAFSYFKKEKIVEVFYWSDDKNQLLDVPWKTDMSISEAQAVCDQITNKKNSQLLTAPISRALVKKSVYDVFVSVVPTAGRGNPNKSSAKLCQELDSYRNTVHSKAKYVIVNLLRYRKSMQYSDTRSEHILEICGVDADTSNLINNFALDRFD